MSIMERQAKLTRDIFEINANTARELFELQMKGLRTYFQTNQDYASKLPEVRDVSTFMEIQRDYGQALWTDAREGLTEGGKVLRTAFEDTGTALREAFSSAAEDVADEIKEKAA